MVATSQCVTASASLHRPRAAYYRPTWYLIYQLGSPRTRRRIAGIALRSVEFAGRHLPTLVNERQHKKFKAPSASLPSSKVGIRVLRNYQEARQWSFLRVEINGRETSLGMKVGAHLRARTHACAPPVSACMVRAHALAHTRTQRTHSYMHKHAHLHTYQGFDQVSVWSSYFRGGIYLAERHPPAKKPRACLYYERVSVGVEVECERERA